MKDMTLELDHERQNFNVWKWKDMALRKNRNQDLEAEKFGAYREVYRWDQYIGIDQWNRESERVPVRDRGPCWATGLRSDSVNRQVFDVL